MKLLEKYIEENFGNPEARKEFLDLASKAQLIKGKIDKSDIEFVFVEQS